MLIVLLKIVDLIFHLFDLLQLLIIDYFHFSDSAEVVLSFWDFLSVFKENGHSIVSHCKPVGVKVIWSVNFHILSCMISTVKAGVVPEVQLESYWNRQLLPSIAADTVSLLMTTNHCINWSKQIISFPIIMMLWFILYGRYVQVFKFLELVVSVWLNAWIDINVTSANDDSVDFVSWDFFINWSRQWAFKVVIKTNHFFLIIVSDGVTFHNHNFFDFSHRRELRFNIFLSTWVAFVLEFLRINNVLIWVL